MTMVTDAARTERLSRLLRWVPAAQQAVLQHLSQGRIDFDELLAGHQSRLTQATPRLPEGGIHDLIRQTAAQYGVDEELVRAVVHAESGFNPKAVSSAGAKGLMQLMDATARSLGVEDSFDPVQNLDGGVRYLRSMLDRFGSVPVALAAYNAGPAAVKHYGGIPPYAETRSYVSKIMQTWQA